MKFFYVIFIVSTLYTQDILNSYTGGEFQLKAKHAYNFPQILGINSLQYHVNRKSEDDIYVMPSRMAFRRTPGATIQLPVEYNVPVADFFSYEKELRKQQDKFFKSFQVENLDRYTYAEFKIEESTVLRIPDIALHFPILDHYGIYMSHQTMAKMDFQMTNKNSSVEFTHDDSDDLKDFGFKANLLSDTDFNFQLSSYGFGGTFKLSDEVGLSVGVNLIQHRLKTSSVSKLDNAVLMIHNVPNNPIDGSPLYPSTHSLTNLDLIYNVDESSMNTQFAVHMSYIPQKDSLNQYETNAHIEIFLKSPTSVNLGTVHLGRRTLPNFLADQTIDPLTFDPANASDVRTLDYYAAGARIFYPGVFALGIRYPYGNQSFGTQISIPLGKFGIDYTERKVTAYKAAKDSIVTESRDREQPLYLDNKFGFALSYGYMVPSWNNFNFNLNGMVYFVEPYYGQSFATIYSTPDRHMFWFANIHISVDIIEKLSLSFNISAPESTVLKTNLSYSF